MGFWKIVCLNMVKGASIGAAIVIGIMFLGYLLHLIAPIPLIYPQPLELESGWFLRALIMAAFFAILGAVLGFTCTNPTYIKSRTFKLVMKLFLLLFSVTASILLTLVILVLMMEDTKIVSAGALIFIAVVALLAGIICAAAQGIIKNKSARDNPDAKV